MGDRVAEVATTTVRLDGRWHGLLNQTTRSAISKPVAFATLMLGRAQRGRQPIAVHDDVDIEDLPLCISTANLQQGHVIWPDEATAKPAPAR